MCGIASNTYADQASSSTLRGPGILAGYGYDPTDAQYLSHDGPARRAASCPNAHPYRGVDKPRNLVESVTVE